MLRRTFLAWVGRLAGVFLGWLSLGGCDLRRERTDTAGADSASPALPGLQLGFFDLEEAATMEAVLERLIPSGVPPGAPGARETRVLNYVDRQLRGSHYEMYQELIRGGVEFLDEVARGQDSVRFHELAVQRQDEVLRQARRGGIRGHPFPTLRFFRVVHTLALEGHWGSPRHGGNHEQLAWRWVGIDLTCGGALDPGE